MNLPCFRKKIFSLSVISVTFISFNITACKDKKNQTLVVSPKAETQKNKNWPIFRGNERLTGYTDTKLTNNIKLLHKFKTEKSITSSPIIANDKVYIGSKDSYLYCLRLENLSLVWKFKSDAAIEAPPLFFDKTIFFANKKGTVYALDWESGKLKWQYSIGAKVLGSGNILKLPNGQASLIIGSYDNKLYSLNTASGKKIWAYETENYINGTPAISANKIIFGGCDAKLHIINGKTGKRQHVINLGGYIAASPALYKNFAFIGHYKGEFLKIDISRQKIIWKYGGEDDAAPFFASPAVGHGLVVIGSRDKKIHAIKIKTGKRVWVFQTRGVVDSSPVIARDKVIVGSSDGRIYLLDLFSGWKLWSYDIGATISASAATAQGKIVVGADNGYVYLFGER